MDGDLETIRHINLVRSYLTHAVANLLRRADAHDLSKLEEPERSAFAAVVPKLRGLRYGSPEYEASRAALGQALAHHYAHPGNRHHPEHFADGIRGMSLLDLLEMVLDWKAAGLRHLAGDIRESIEKNQARFGYGDELKAVLLNTVAELGLLPGEGGAEGG